MALAHDTGIKAAMADTTAMEPGARPLRACFALPGTATTAYHGVAALQRLGYDLDFEVSFYYKHPGWAENLKILPPALRQRLERELRRRHFPDIDPKGIHLHPSLELLLQAGGRLGLPKTATQSLLALRNEAFDRQVARKIAEDPPDILIGQDTSSLHSLKAAKSVGRLAVLNQVIGHRLSAKKILSEEAELCPDFADSLPRFEESGRERRLMARCREEALEADLILAPSAYVCGTLLELGCDPARLALLPYGADIARFRPPAEPDDSVFRLCFVGQIGQRKGIKYLLEAVRRLKLPKIEVLLVGPIVGSGEGLAPYRDLFSWVPSVPYAEVPAYYRQASVFVYPSLHEGSATVIYEALASGLPVITTPNTGSVVEDGKQGFVVPIRDVEALMARIEQLYRDRTLRRAMSVQARRLAEHYTWSHYGETLDALLRSRLEAR